MQLENKMSMKLSQKSEYAQNDKKVVSNILIFYAEICVEVQQF